MKWKPLLPGISLFAALSLLGGCSALPGAPRWGEGVTLRPGWDRVGKAAADAALAPETWAPLAGAAVFWAADLDDPVSDWAADHHPVFGSRKGADHTSDYLAWGTIAAYGVTVLATPSGDHAGEWTLNKIKGGLVGTTAFLATEGLTGLLKDATNRTRPDGSDTKSFPSGHAADASVFSTLTSRNLEYLPLSPHQRTAGRVGLAALTAGTAWARVEADMHFPSDVLAGIAIGHFFGAFLSDAFLGQASPVILQPAVDLSEKSASINLFWTY